MPNNQSARRLRGFTPEGWRDAPPDSSVTLQLAELKVAGADPPDYFIRSKFFWRICQSGSAANFSRLVLMIFASFAFLVGRLTL